MTIAANYSYEVLIGAGKSFATEEAMRSVIVLLGVVTLTAVAFWQPAIAAKSKMGCEIGKEVWNATEGKCMPGTPKHAKAHGKSTAKKAPAGK
jgi:hypothetical protein